MKTLSQIAENANPLIRVTLMDEFIMRPLGVWRVVQDGYGGKLVPYHLDQNPWIMTKPVQDYLLSHIGFEQHCLNALDRYYYEGDDLPSTDEIRSARKVRSNERRWRKSSVRTASAKEERLIALYDEEEAVDFMMRFGKNAERKKSK